VIRPYPRAGYIGRAREQALLGNAALYGATSGRLFAAGRAGDRFAVRNSGAVAVVEGVGAHGCEYMTGGTVVVLGKTGANFGAGMTNGVAYVLDEDALFATRCNTDLVVVEDLGPGDDEALVPLLVAHAERTGSAIARTILSSWPGARSAFRRVAPKAAPALAQTVQSAQPTREEKDEKQPLARPA
jgi:glutamate synthase domain-containing protein 3